MSNDTSNIIDAPNYILAIEDKFDQPYSTLHTFTDPEIWNWIHQPVTFPQGVSRVKVSIPGTKYLAEVTQGSYQDDKAQSLLVMTSEQTDPLHPNLVEIDFDEKGYEATLESLIGPETKVYYGVWY